MRTPGSTGRVARWLMAIGGVASFGLGGLGIVVPGLPTTVFVLLGSYLLTRSCPWIEERLANTPLFRPYARYVDPAVPMPRPVKVRAVGAMWFFITVSIFMTPRRYSSAMNRDATPVGRCPRDRIKPRQLEARLAAGQRWQGSGLVFSTPIGTPLDGRNVTRAFKDILVGHGLPTIRIHDLRHSCATLLLMQAVSPRVVMETLGHSQVSLTLNTYSHVLPALQEDAAAKMDAILSRS